MTADPHLQSTLTRMLQHQAAGRIDEALGLIEAAISENADNLGLLHFKGQILVQKGDVQNGLALMKTALDAFPDSPLQLSDYGAILAQTGDLDAAAECFESAISVAPKFAAAHGNLGGVHVLKRNYAKAISHLKTAVELDPKLIDAHKNLGNTYLQCNRFDQAIDILYRGLAIDPEHVGLHLLLSDALYRRDRFEAAEHHARRALDIEPNAQEAYIHIGNAQASSGQLERAAESYIKVAGKSPVGIPALSKLVQTRTAREGSPELAMIKDLLNNLEGVGQEAKATISFAAGKVFDDLGHYDQAFGHFQSANDILAELYPYDRQLDLDRSKRLSSFSSPELLERCAGSGIDSVAPIFICGMPRSGTTLLEQMFSRHPDVQTGGEMLATHSAFARNERIIAALEERLPEQEITADDFTRFGEDYLAFVRADGIRKECFTDKLPLNYRYIGLLSLAFPRATFLILRRHPLDCLLSNYFQHFARNQPFTSKLENLAAVYREFHATSQMWAQRLPERVLQVSYEETANGTDREVRAACKFAGLPWNKQMLDPQKSSRHVGTASIAQVRQPIHSGSVSRWRNYSKHLQLLALELSDHISNEDKALLGL